MAGAARQHTGGRAFWWRLADNLFRRFVLFVLPIAIFGAVGVMQAMNTTALYRSSATLSASTNPLLPQTPVSGVDVQLWETPAAATSRIISERLSTNAFLEAVAEQAGLGEALESGAVTIDIVRASIWSSSGGESILSVNATWADAQTAYQLVEATLTQYAQFLNETVASDAAEAEEFFSGRLEALQVERDDAEGALTDFVDGLPPLAEGDDYPVTVQVQIDRLSGQLESIEAEMRSVEDRVDEAVLTRSQQTTAASNSFSVVDAPEVPGAPESTFMKKAMLVIAFALMGAVVAFAALVLTTALDHGVASVGELLALPGVSQVATVPPVAIGRRPSRRGRGRRGRRRRVERAGVW